MCTQNVNVDSSPIDIGFRFGNNPRFRNLLLRFTHKRFYTPDADYNPKNIKTTETSYICVVWSV